ncbi:unnamed protein product [Moneuplotes crassus]|uniref:Uncharacterized protein n=1 Tax=Euplotes crassus TaxID=5936 RepID=A0AAD1XDJ5_EUPCR|nr:unnamed protein product [Moneuplotes crassus]
MCCQDGYYSFNNGCKPCDSSCKTCSSDASCDTCELFMQLSASNFCEYCPDGEYFDFTSKLCRSCPSTCDGACAYQSSCFECPVDQSLDLKTLECVDSCDSLTQVKLTGLQISFPSVCRDFEYYVDPTSTEIIELGTQKYPYRTLKSVTSEILNHLSHKQVEVTIYTKDVYLEDKTMLFINITNIKITTHPDFIPCGRKARLTLTEFIQPTLSSKARVHLLSHTDLPFKALITEGNFTDSEKTQTDSLNSNCIVRSGIEFNNIDIYREQIDHSKDILFLQAIYLQNMDIRFINTFINISGQVLLTIDPFNLVIHDSKIDMFTLTMQFLMYAGCNYPEAYTTATIDVRNYTMMNSKDRVINRNPYGIDSNHAGNWTIKDLDATTYYGTITNVVSSISIVQFPNCNPDDDLIKTIDIDGADFSLPDSDPSKISGFHSDISVQHYRPIHIIGQNLHFFNLSYPGFPLLALGGTQIDTLYIKSMKVTNCDLVDALFYSAMVKEVIFGDNTQAEPSIEIDSLSIMIPSAFLVQYLQKFEINNLKLTNFTGSPAVDLAFIQFMLFPNSIFQVRSLEVIQSNFLRSKLVLQSEFMNQVIFEDISVKSCLINPSSSLFSLNSIQSIQFSNGIFDGIVVSDPNDISSSIISLEDYTLQNPLNSQILNVEVFTSQVSVFNIEKLSGSALEEQIFEFTNIFVHDMIIPSSRSLIDTSGFVGTGDLKVIMDNLTFVRVNYSRSGNNLKFSHSLDNEIIVKNSHFSNSDSSSILLDRSGDGSDVRTVVKFENVTFSNNIVKNKAAIQASNAVKLILVDSVFTQTGSLFERSTLFHSEEGSELVITNCEFSENYGLAASLFTMESGSHVQCSNCTIKNNFALSGGLARAINNGYFSIVNSTITQNHAIQASIAQIFDASETSTVDSSELFNNSPITSNEYESETTSCSKLCFLSDEFKQYVENDNLHKLVESQVLFEVISGSFSVRNSSNIHSEQHPILSLMSDIEIDSSTLRNLSFSSTSIKVATSTIVLNNVTFEDIFAEANSELILGDIGSVLNLTDIIYKSSNALFLRISSSQLYANQVMIENIHTPQVLLNIEKAERVSLNNFEIINSTVTSDELVHVSRSAQVEMDGFVARNNTDKNVMSITNSHVSLLQNLNIKSSLRALEIIQTIIDRINGSTFINNGNIDSSTGGAILVQNSKVRIENSTFNHNAGLKGSAIAFECTSLELCDLSLDDVNFTNQRASQQGGAINYNYKPPVITNCTFTNNSAQYGPDIASYPVRIRMTQDIHSDMSLTNVGPGIGLDSSIKLSLLDFDNQTMVMNNDDQISIFAVDTQSSSVRGTNTVQLEKGVSEFDSIQFVSEIGSKNVKYRAVSKAIDNTKVNKLFNSSLVENQITVNFRFCKPGERIDNQNICTECSAGTYSLKWNSTFCSKCMNNAFCPGKEQIQVTSGHWRNTRNSTEIKECLKSDACKGGFDLDSTHPVECAEGYTGNLCSKCVVTKNVKYAQTGDYECSKCPNPVLNAIRVVGAALLVFAFLCFMIIINIRKTKESNLSVLFRILTNYIQIVSTSISLTANYPSSVTSFFSIVDEIGSSSETFLSFDCFIEDYEVKGPFSSNSVFKLFLMGLLPIILFTLVALIWVIIKTIGPSSVKSLERNFVISFISILFLLHPTITEQSFGLFRCVEIDEGVNKVRIDMDMDCYSSRHLKYCLMIAVPIILIWVICFPLIALILLIKYINKPGENKIKNYFLILFQGLNKSSFYWEFVNTARKISVIITFPFNTTTRLLCALIVLIVFTRLNDTLKPYKENAFNSLEISGSNAGIVILAAGLVYSQDEEVNSLNTIMMIIMIVFNCHFILEWTYQFLNLYLTQYKLLRPLSALLRILLLKKKPTPPPSEAPSHPINQPSSPRKKKSKSKYKHKKLLKKKHCKKKRIRFAHQSRRDMKSPDKLAKDPSYLKKVLEEGVIFDDLSETDRALMLNKISTRRGGKLFWPSARKNELSIEGRSSLEDGIDLYQENGFSLQKSIQAPQMFANLKEESKSHPSRDSLEIPVASSSDNPDSLIPADLILECSKESNEESSKFKTPKNPINASYA